MNCKTPCQSVVMLMALTLSLLLTSCDSHIEFPDNAMKIGHVLCSDGDVHPLDVALSSGKTPVAVVFHVKGDETLVGEGYAVYIHDLPSAAFADSLGVKQGTSSDITAFDGNANTFAMFNTPKIGSPIAIEVFDMWHYGQSAYIGSVAEMKLLYSVKGVVNAAIWQCGGEPLSENADECWYWTSSEVEGQETAKAWLYSLGSGAYHETPKDEPHKVRPIVTIHK